MKALDELISTLDISAPVKEVCQGVFHTGVLTKYCGLAATLPKDALRQKPPLVSEPGSLLDKTAGALAGLAYSESLLEAAIGMATINSLLEVEMYRCIELNAADLILEKGEGRNVVIVGHFPFIPRVRERAKALWVIEKNPCEGDYQEKEADRFISQADVAAITGTSLTNHTFEHLLGDTVPLSPVLFDYGVDALSGTRVVDPILAMKCISQGANFRQIKGVKRLTMTKGSR